jgi:hypothetical protein
MGNTSTSLAEHHNSVSAAQMIRMFVTRLHQHPDVEVRVRLGRPASPQRVRGARVPRNLADFYAEMDGADVRWWFQGSDPEDPDAGGAARIPTLRRNLRGWSRSDFFTDDPTKPRQIRIPDEVPLQRRYDCRPLWFEGHPGDNLLMLWEIGGDTCSEVGLSGIDDYIERGIDRLFVSEWTTLISDFKQPEVEERLARVYERLGLSQGWLGRVLREGVRRR